MAATDTSLDDIFGSSPPEQIQPRSIPVELSELPSLRRQHVTAGYRDGISASKAEHVQRGFDAGFPVGAQLGMRAGTILGIIEGVLRGYECGPASAVVRKQKPTTTTTTTDTDIDEMKRVKCEQVLRLYRQAAKELNVQTVFAGVNGEGKSQEKPEDQLLRKGDAVLAEWEKGVRVSQWEENMDTLEEKSENGANTNSGEKEGVVKGAAGQS